MGFKPEPTIYSLKFAQGHNLCGLTVRITGCSVGEWNRMIRLASGRDATVIADSNDEIRDIFLKHLVEWDLEDDNGPVARTPEGYDSQDNRIMNDIVAAWHVAMTGVPEDLGKDSENGSAFLERSLGMTAESPSPPS